MIIRSLAILSALVFSTSSLVSFASVSLTPEPVGRAVVIENETLKLVLDPDRGGTIVSFVHKTSNRDIVPRDKKYMGLFMDHLWGQTWPGELLEVPYEMEVSKRGPDEVIAKVWRTVAGSWQGTDQKIIRGLVVEKTFTVKAGLDAVFCHIAVKNPQPEGRLPAYWTQHVFFAGGDYEATDDVFFRPSSRGVRVSYQGSKQEDFLRDPVAGWSAAVDRKKGQGVVFLLDYNDLDMLYNCGGNLTLEWMFDKIPVPSGREWTTEEVLIPTEGLTDFAHASANLIAGLQATRSGNELTVRHFLRGALDKLENVVVSLEVAGAADRKTVSSPPLPLGPLSTGVRVVKQILSVPSADPLMLTVIVKGERSGKPFVERYPVFFPGSYGYGDNVQQDMTTPLIRVTRPQKHQELMRPAKIERTRGQRLKVFILKGLNADQYQLEEALTLLGAEVSVGAYSIGQEGPRTTDFPFDYGALMSCDVIVVANANVQCLGKLGLEMLGDYATHGGNLLFLGGKSAYGSGGLAGSGLEGLLPVVVRTSLFDITTPVTRSRGGDEAVLRLSNNQRDFQGLNMQALPTCRYLHDANLAPGATTFVTAGNKPFLVAKENNGGGRVACMLGTVHGPSLEREIKPSFQKWSGWTVLMSQLLKWLARGSTA